MHVKPFIDPVKVVRSRSSKARRIPDDKARKKAFQKDNQIGFLMVVWRSLLVFISSIAGTQSILKNNLLVV